MGLVTREVMINWMFKAHLHHNINPQLPFPLVQALQPLIYAAFSSYRDYFQQCLGNMYDSCVNRYYLMNKPQSDWVTVMTYIQVWQHLDFLCNVGFEQVATPESWGCIQGRIGNTADKACQSQFNTTLGGNFNNLCP